MLQPVGAVLHSAANVSNKERWFSEEKTHAGRLYPGNFAPTVWFNSLALLSKLIICHFYLCVS